MIQMVIADDEPVITRGLKKIIDWNRLGINIVGCYDNGKDALNGILAQNADIALLDVNMPEKSGIDILEELHRIKSKTQVIFISGFQEFEYARAALEYGAKGYLLKPIIREELVEKVEKCIEESERVIPSEWMEKEGSGGEPYHKLIDMENTVYTLVLIHIVYQNEGCQERKLIEFSVINSIEQYVEEDKTGVVFRKDKGNFIVFKEKTAEECQECLIELNRALQTKTGYKIQGIIGETTDTLGDIPAIYQKCLNKKGCFFFMRAWKKDAMMLHTSVVQRKTDKDELRIALDQLIELIITQKYDQALKQYEWYQRLAAIMSEGSKEDACYYFCNGITEIMKRLDSLNIIHVNYSASELLREGRGAFDFLEMAEIFQNYVLGCYRAVQESVGRNATKDIQHAKQYIDGHYQENLSLNILADEMCMNPYYFSSFFKKNSGLNFKEYLNEVRLEHAVSLLISTDKKQNEIADEVGFGDERSFTKTFKKKYGESPALYKKKVLTQNNSEKSEV